MSWQSYIDDQLIAAGCMYAAIMSKQGAIWASSEGFTPSEAECTTLAQALDNNFDLISGSGFTVATQKYTFTRGEADEDEGGPSYIQGRCKEDGKSGQGIIIYGTTQAVIIGVHDPNYSDGATFRKVNTDIGRIADYILELGY